ncbi:uncharacterized protein LOC135339913 isoform X4 [Halichondria panicea]|uniref:uncharacterized protein LOC135339913 isoform X4 n=1 Tax=Halichondria panicea TaxID=6063 RepID=UPI00312B5F1B
MAYRDSLPTQYSLAAQERSIYDNMSIRELIIANNTPYPQESGSSVPMYINPTSSHHPTQVSSSDATVIESPQIAFGSATHSVWYQNMTVYNNEANRYDEYNMHYDIGRPPGYAILLGNDREYPADPELLPVMKDLRLMNDVLHSCGWKVSPIAGHPDMTSKQFDAMFNPILSSDFNQYSCFMFYYTGHGNSKGLLLSDGCCKPYVDIVQRVSSIYSLVGKPKIFIFDSCRSGKEKSHHWNFFKGILRAHVENVSVNYPPSDTLICYSANEGMQGYSHDNYGSCYTFHLAAKLRQFWNTLTFTEIVTLVHGWTVQLAQQWGKGQQPVVYNALNRLLMFGGCDVSQYSQKMFHVPNNPSTQRSSFSYIVKGNGPNSLESDVATDAIRTDRLLSAQFKTKQDVTNNLPRLGQGVSVFVCYAPDPESPYYDPKERKDEIVRNQTQITHLICDLERIGFSVISDLHLGNSQPRNWLQWYVSRIELCDYLIMVCSPAFKELFSCDKQKFPIADERASWFLTYRNAMYAEISEEVKDSPSGSKFVPVIIDDSFPPQDCVPTLLLTATKYQLNQKVPREFKYDNMYGGFEQLVCRMAGIDRVQMKIKQHPQDMLTKVGEDAKFFIAVTASSPGQISYNWCFNNQSVSDYNADYKGATTSELVVLKSLSKHCGSYKCIVTHQFSSDVQVPSFSAVLEIDGTKIEVEESNLLGIILQNLTSLQDDELDLNIKELLSGTSNLTYEELQIVLGQTTHTSYLSTGLKQKLKTRIQEDKIYDEAIKNDKKIKLFYLKMLALGPGQIGKSTFIRRLLGIMQWDIDEDPENGPTRSTGQSECREVFLGYNHESVALSTEQSWHVLGESDIGKELRALISLLNIQTEAKTLNETVAPEETKVIPQASLQQSDSSDSNVIPTNKTKSENNSVAVTTNTCPSSEQSPDTPKAQTKSQRSEIDEAYEEFEKLRYSKHYTSSDSPDDDIKSIHAIINIADVGGQPAFLELLPSLTIGPAMYLVFMKLLWELDVPKESLYKGENEMEALVCKNYTYTPEEVIFTALSSIACFGHSDKEVEKYLSSDQDAKSDANKKKISSLALIMGTYADELQSGGETATEQVKETNQQLRATLDTTPFYEDGLINYSNLIKKEVLFQINNKSGGKPEVDNYRKLIKKLIESRFRQYTIPARWLMFSICLKILAQKKKKSVIEFPDCVKVGDCFKMNEKTVKCALTFLHKYIGLVMYFQKEEKLKLSKDIVICDPQAVFTSISDLIFNIYDPNKRNVKAPVFDRFTQKGFFSPEDHTMMEAITAKKNHFPIEDLIPLLEYLNIAVPMVMDSISGYFLPAVLQTATSEVLNTTLEGADPDRDPEPLCVRFKTSFVPLGFVSALVANLLNDNNKDLLLLGKEQDKVVYKNKITFRFRGRYNIVLISRAKYCEFRVSRPPGAVEDEEFSSTNCCPLLKDMLQKSIKNVIDRMRQSSLFQLSHGYDFAFKCPQSNCKETMGSRSSLVVINPADLKSLTCESCKIAIHATLQMKTWFTKDLAHDIIDDQKDPRTTSLNELMVKYEVTDEQLDREIEQDDLVPVAMHFDNVELYLNPLKLTGNEQVDVKRDACAKGNEIAVINCLSIWRGHEPSEATFRVLISILWDLRKEKIATNICQYLKKKDHGTFREEYLVQDSAKPCISQTLRKSDSATQTVPDNKSTQRTSFSYPSPLLKGKGPNSLESDVATDAIGKGRLLSVQFKTKQDVINNLPRLGQGVSVFVCYAPDPESPYYDPKERKDEIVHNQSQITHLISDLDRVGFSVISDLHFGNSQPSNWLQWYVSHIELCDYLIMVCSPAFKELFSCDKQKFPIADERASWFLTYRDVMYAEISEEVKDSPTGSKFVPVIIDDSFPPQDCVPTLLLTATTYQLDQKVPREFKYGNMYGGFEQLVCRMAGIDRNKLDAPKNIPTKPPKGYKRVPWVPEALATKQQPQSHPPPAKRVVSPEPFQPAHVAPFSQPPHHPPPSQPDQLPDKPPEHTVILWLCDKITDWRFVAHFLKIDNSEIERIGIDYHDCVMEQRYQMFESWKRHEWREYTYRTLGDVLLKTESNRHLYPEFCRRVEQIEQTEPN